MSIERRVLDLETREIIIKPLTVEARSNVEGFVKIKGVFKLGTLSETMYNQQRNCYFKEFVSSGAFVDCINKMEQGKIFPQLLINHNWKQKLDVIDFKFEEENGEFKFEYLVKKTPFIIRNMENIKAFSFGFIVDKDNWTKNINGTYTRQIEGFKIIKEFSILLDKEPCYSQASTEFKVSELRPCNEEDIIIDSENGQVENDTVASKQEFQLEEMKKYITKKKIEDFKKLKEHDNLKKSVNTLKNKPEIEKLKAEIKQLKKM
ncbi:HK97 family phage prohead protease [Clostridium perfringens]|uniref:HK97 family phage prohead protease n=1 Tax=Clostridium perfringens TaxID=1502 RepID=UPI0018E41807|nr:HK97 family phage prohead protease [Clostridium perfringens]ELC8343613.1 HK97 family phage prohead protease [Clostridium perfringens]MBI6081256.1 HK97 family phage prohead protease [Clostridium perfringens]MDK0646448.1 HK97 family phage prohead protease [Clostridium perfringens]MDM0895995.1 HK97 family phage prohead protease [Clostridium perfringens]MDU5650067.1 HK97 family phage prohead protease [Clostridium perfringens]